MIVPVILSGGSGTRLWPLSRSLHPKQYLRLVDERTMLQNTVLRLNGLAEPGGMLVLCNEEQRFTVAEQLRVIDRKAAAIILEPVGKNTAPAVAVAAFKALEADPDPILLVLPADHHIRDGLEFLRAVKVGEDLARQGRLIAFGIQPRSPETGYGYIRSGDHLAGSAQSGPEAFEIDEFVEKPDLETARKYMDSGDYFWNSGMFMFSANTFLDELRHFAPEMVEACQKACAGGESDLDFFRLDAEAFKACPSDSLDYAIMEKTENGAVVPLAVEWSDLGSWDALWQVRRRDENQNVTIGDVITHDVEDCFLQSTDRLLAVIGVRDHIVVETADAVLVTPKDRVQDVKVLVERLRAQGRDEADSHKKVYRPWGSYESIDLGDRFQVKRITVKPGAKLSLQKHFHRAEHWIVVRGTALVIRDEEQIVLEENQSTYIPLGAFHRLENPGKILLELIEVQSGSYLGEDDIVRTEDVYGRGK